MKRFLVVFAVAFLLPVAVTMPVIAQGDDPQATIEALQTRVTGLEETIEALAPTVAPTTPPQPTPSLDQQPLFVGGGVEILYYDIHEGEDYSVLVGEYRNISGGTMYSPKLEITVFDAEGNVLGALNAFAVVPEMDHGDVVPFSTEFTNDYLDPDEWVTETIVGCETIADFDDEASSLLSIEDLEEVEKSERSLQLTGKIANGGDTPAERVTVRAILRNEEGRFIGDATGFADAAVPAGRTAPFRLDAYGSDMVGVEDDSYTYELWVGITSGVSVSSC